MLDDAHALEYLVRRGLIPPHIGAAPDITFQRLRGRTLLYRVDSNGTPWLLLKRAVDPETRRGIAREIATYEHLGPFRSHLASPRSLDYDPDTATLVLEFLHRRSPLTDAGSEFDSRTARELGLSLARVHRVPPPTHPLAPPWILGLVHPPVGILRGATPATLELIGRIQRSPTWRHALEGLTDEWGSVTLVHGDLRFSNILVPEPTEAGEEESITFVDWELSGGGDPCWDVGCVLSEILATGIDRLPATLLLLEEFWAGYAGGVRKTRDVSLERTIRWTAAAVLQRAYEEASDGVPGSWLVERLLEIGGSLLERPTVWVERVFSRGAPPGIG